MRKFDLFLYFLFSTSHFLHFWGREWLESTIKKSAYIIIFIISIVIYILFKRSTKLSKPISLRQYYGRSFKSFIWPGPSSKSWKNELYSWGNSKINQVSALLFFMCNTIFFSKIKKRNLINSKKLLKILSSVNFSLIMLMSCRIPLTEQKLKPISLK